MVDQEIKIDSGDNIVDQKIKTNGGDTFMLEVFAVFLFVLSFIFFGTFIFYLNSIDANDVANSIIFQWASLISVLLGIGMVAFAVLYKLNALWDIVKLQNN